MQSLYRISTLSLDARADADFLASTPRSPMPTHHDDTYQYHTPPPPPSPACKSCNIYGESDLFAGSLLLPTFSPSGDDSPRDVRQITLNPRISALKLPFHPGSGETFDFADNCPALVQSFDVSDDEKEDDTMEEPTGSRFLYVRRRPLSGDSCQTTEVRLRPRPSTTGFSFGESFREL